MKISFSNSILGLFAATFLLSACGSTALVSTPIENIDTVPLKIAPLNEDQKKNWGHLDLIADTIPGMSVDKAYAEIIKDKKGKQVIVAVLDSGMDLDHEDLKDVLWTNKKEVSGNNKDDDNNGYVDDIHGYNFLGESYNEELEATRILRLKLGDAAYQAQAREKYDEDVEKAEQRKQITKQNKEQSEKIMEVIQEADVAAKKELGKETYTTGDLAALKSEDPMLKQYVSILTQLLASGSSISEIKDEVKSDIDRFSEGYDYYTEQLEYNLNLDFDGRKVVGDNPYDITDTGYGNGNPHNRVEDEAHATHVAGIIGAVRNNGIGMDGVANNVAIMSIRAVPNGDEYDKDIALGIRYAVDNGAKVINGSFGKPFSPNAKWVYDAIEYAASKDVLFVHAAGNDGQNLDDPQNANFPNDQIKNGPEIADNVITVGAINENYGSEMVTSFSNYGAINVDIFAPGQDIYSTVPGSKYKYFNGTSMASPAVAGLAALIRSQYPKLTAPEVKHIIMQSGLSVKTPQVLGGDESNTGTLKEISKSGKIANAYNALILADQVSHGKVKLNLDAK